MVCLFRISLICFFWYRLSTGNFRKFVQARVLNPHPLHRRSVRPTPQPGRKNKFSRSFSNPSPPLYIPTPQTLTPPPHYRIHRRKMDPKPASTPRRSLRLLSDPSTPKTPASAKKSDRIPSRSNNPPPPITPSPAESRKRSRTPKNPNPRVSKTLTPKKPKKTHYKKVIYDGGEFEVGDDVYIKRREDAESDAEEPEIEECRICFKVGNSVMIECDDCLGGFHLRCLKPPLRKVPEGDWICGFCERKRKGKAVEMPRPPEGKKLKRTAKEKLLSSDLWAARIER